MARPRTTRVSTATDAYGSPAPARRPPARAARPAAAAAGRAARRGRRRRQRWPRASPRAGPTEHEPGPVPVQAGDRGRIDASVTPAVRELAPPGRRRARGRRRPARRTPARSPGSGDARACAASEPPSAGRREQPGRDRLERQLSGTARVDAAEQRLQQPVGHLGPEPLVDVRRRSPRRRSSGGAGRSGSVSARPGVPRASAPVARAARSVGTPSSDGGRRRGSPVDQQPWRGRASGWTTSCRRDRASSTARPPRDAGPASTPRPASSRTLADPDRRELAAQPGAGLEHRDLDGRAARSRRPRSAR